MLKLTTDYYQLLDSEVPDVQKTALDNGWTVTALHNYELFEKPLIKYIHAQKNDKLDTKLSQLIAKFNQMKCGCTYD